MQICSLRLVLVLKPQSSQKSHQLWLHINKYNVALYLKHSKNVTSVT